MPGIGDDEKLVVPRVNTEDKSGDGDLPNNAVAEAKQTVQGEWCDNRLH